MFFVLLHSKIKTTIKAMLILDKPYVSDYLKETATKFQFPVLKTEFSQTLNLNSTTVFYSEEEAIDYYQSNPNARIYTNSENAIHWIVNNLSDTHLPDKIKLFKDKIAFRKLTQNMFPEVFFLAVKPSDLDKIDLNELPKSFVIKPAVGFFSLAVFPVQNHSEWPSVKQKLKKEIEIAAKLFPAAVLDSTELIIEGYISGVEFAFDAYYDEHGIPTILTILKHEFASSEDVSDRVYLTSKTIMETYLNPFTDFLTSIGNLAGLKNFPLHVEVRVNEAGDIIPIEVNPLRFGGFCTTADLTPYAWGFNPYAAFFNNYKPKWEEILKDKAGKLFSLIVLDNSTKIDGAEIKQFDYEKLKRQFEKPLELREFDFKNYPLFGFLFTETREENFDELASILKSDLVEFVERLKG
jgi:hypothetical protein